MEKPKVSHKILVIGSSNTDMVIVTDHFPQPGETILGGRFLLNPGGKGANQAVAASRLGGNVALIARLGEDVFGQQAILQLQDEGIDTSGIQLDPSHPSGVAQITVDQSGENTIVVAPGANAKLSQSVIDQNQQLLENAEIILMQLEIPLSTVEYVSKKAYKLGKKVILNPAPATFLSDELYTYLSIITPNETEAEFLTGIKVNDEKSALNAANFFIEKGVKSVIITMGAAGAYLFSPWHAGIIPAPRVKALDTTAAGDTFNGALAVALSQGKNLVEAVNFANKAASLSVTKMGAQSSIPTLYEL